MKNAIISSLLFILSAFSWAQSTTAETAESIYFEHGVKVNYSGISSVVPTDWKKKPVDMKSQKLVDADLIREVNEILAKELRLYPDGIKKYLSRIHIVKSLGFYGQEYGGTYFDKEIVIATDFLEDGKLDRKNLGDTLHHELSSILLGVIDFPKNAWKSHNKGFSYGEGGVDAIESGKSSTEFDIELVEKGITCQYAAASFEEDFNMFSQFLLTSKKLQRIIKNNENLKGKYQLWLNHYKSLDSSFNLN